MTNEKKLAMLEELMELEEGTLKADDTLIDIEEWNSMAKLSLIVLMDEEFNKKLSGNQIKEFKTIQDIINVMD